MTPIRRFFHFFSFDFATLQNYFDLTFAEHSFAPLPSNALGEGIVGFQMVWIGFLVSLFDTKPDTMAMHAPALQVCLGISIFFYENVS